MNAPLLAVRDLAVRFAGRHGEVEAVRGVDLTLDAGRCLAVVGESGSGKSVTARAVVGLAGPTATVDASQLSFEGEDLRHYGGRQWRRLRGARIGFVLQDALTSLDPLRRIEDEVGEPLGVHALVPRGDRRARVVSLLQDVGIPDPEERARQYPHELSGGLRQRALIASAIAAGPPLLVADEPTTALDVTVQAQVLDLLAARRDAGTAVLLISHDLTVVARMADRIAVMYAGLIVEQGAAEQVLAKPAHPYTRDLLAAAPALDPRARTDLPVLLPPAPGPGCPYRSRCRLAEDRCSTHLPPLAAPEGDRALRCWSSAKAASPPVVGLSSPPLTRPEPGKDVLRVEDLAKRFRSPSGWRQAVDGVSFELRSGESLGVVGESGSGKTTLAHLVLGILNADGGRVLLDGSDWTNLPENRRRPLRSRIQLIHQDPLSSFDPRYSVERIVGEALGRHARRTAATGRDQVIGLLHRVGLDATILPRRGVELSGGQRQRVAIARALAPDPQLIVCDEPVSALDVSVQAQILDLFTTLRHQLGVALLFISHDLAVVRQVCDRTLVMKDGAVVEHGPVDEVFQNPRHPYTRSLIEAVTLTNVQPAGRSVLAGKFLTTEG